MCSLFLVVCGKARDGGPLPVRECAGARQGQLQYLPLGPKWRYERVHIYWRRRLFRQLAAHAGTFVIGRGF